MIKAIKKYAVARFIPLSMLILHSPSLAYAIQYSTECRVEPNGKEICKEIRMKEEKTNPLPKAPPSTPEEDTPFELGGLLVTQKINVCKDEIDTCDDLIGTEKDQWCDPVLGLRDKCMLTCAACVVTDKIDDSAPKQTTIGVAQLSGGEDEEKERTNEVLTEMVKYLREVVLVQKGYKNMYRQCVNTHELCAFWASLGECDSNPNYMSSGCMLACKKCHEHKDFITV